jgi:hypothetical protein
MLRFGVDSGVVVPRAASAPANDRMELRLSDQPEPPVSTFAHSERLDDGLTRDAELSGGDADRRADVDTESSLPVVSAQHARDVLSRGVRGIHDQHGPRHQRRCECGCPTDHVG